MTPTASVEAAQETVTLFQAEAVAETPVGTVGGVVSAAGVVAEAVPLLVEALFEPSTATT